MNVPRRPLLLPRPQPKVVCSYCRNPTAFNPAKPKDQQPRCKNCGASKPLFLNFDFPKPPKPPGPRIVGGTGPGSVTITLCAVAAIFIGSVLAVLVSGYHK